MNNYNYINLSSYGKNINNIYANPMLYCLNTETDNSFYVGGATRGLKPGSKKCTLFLSDYCAKNWDSTCETLYNDKSKPFVLENIDGSANPKMTSGQKLLYETACKKYLSQLLTGEIKYEMFDVIVPESPKVSYWQRQNNKIVPEYEIKNPENINSDPVMNHILENPEMYMNILINIYNTMNRKGTLKRLKGTNLGNFYNL